MRVVRTLIRYLRFFGGKYKCIVCGRPVRTFFPFSHELQKLAKSHKFPYDFRRMETLNYDNCNCPFCLSSDRERLYLIYLEKYFDKSDKTHRVLDFAASKFFSQNLRSRPRVQYTTADLYNPNVDLQLDICDMHQIDAGQYDIVICSHILEHVKYPEKALNEIFRILTSTGFAIIMVPLFTDVIQTVEDEAHNSDSLRLQHYGQNDHVRLYSKRDFLNQLKNSGFVVDEVRANQLDSKLLLKNAISENSILYVCSKS